MKKIVLSAVGIAVAGALVAPHFIGQSAEQQVHTIVEAINSNPGYQAEVTSYQRDWFSSQGTLEVTLEIPLPQDDGTTKTVSLHSGELALDIQHGPVLTQFDAGVGMLAWQLTANDDAKREQFAWAADKPLYKLTGSTGLLGHTEYADSIADVTYQDPSADLTVKLAGYSGTGSFASDSFSYQGNNESLTLSVDGDSLVVDNIGLQMEGKGTLQQMIASELLDSHGVITVEQATNADVPVMQGARLAVTSTLAEDKETITVDFDTDIETLVLPTGDAQGLTLKSSLKRLDVDFVKAYQTLVKSSYGQPQEQVNEQMRALFEQHQAELVAANPEVVISELSGQLPAGSFSSQLKLALADVDQLPTGDMSVKYWLQKLIANGAATADKALVRNALTMQLSAALVTQVPNADASSEQFQTMIDKQVEQVIRVYLQQGFMVEQDGQYQSEFAFEQGTLTLNGKPMPLM